MLDGVDLDSSGWTPEQVGGHLDRVDALGCFVTRRQGEQSHDWLASEFTMALERPRIERFQIILEEGEQLPGPMRGRPVIPLDRERALPAFGRLAHQIGTWALEAGRPTWVRLEQDDMSNVLAQHPRAVCRYRFLQSRTGDESDWQDATLRTIDRERRVRVEWPEDHDFVMLQLVEAGQPVWETSWHPHLVSIRHEVQR